MSTILDHRGNPIARDTQPKKRAYLGNYYRAGESNRYRTSIPYQIGDSSQTLNKAIRRRLMGYARWLYVNNGMVRGAVNDLARYSVGCGIRPQSLLPDVGNEYEDYFTEWAKVADVSGVFSFWQMQRLASVRMDIDGDLGFAFINNGFPQLQAIESHVIESPMKDQGEHDGVYANVAGRPLRYSLRSGKGFRNISANDFALVFDPDRVMQLRGVTALAHAIEHIHDQIDILEYEKVGVKMASAIGVAIKTEGGTADGGSDLIENGYTATDTGTVAWSTFQPGMVPHLKVGESIDSFASNRPNPTFTGFLEHLTREVALGLGLPYEFVIDPAKQGTASRFILEKAQRRFEERQDTICKFSNRVWTWVIANGIKRKEIPMSDAFWKVRWQAPKKITVDNGRDSKANLDGLKFGNRTLAEDAGERGQDWETMRTQIEREADDLLERSKRLSEKHGITVNEALQLLSQRTPNPVFTSNDQSSTDSPNSDGNLGNQA